MTRYSVPDMSCGHCRASITEAVTALAPDAPLSFDMERREVTLEADLPPATVLAALDKIGFPATVAG